MAELVARNVKTAVDKNFVDVFDRRRPDSGHCAPGQCTSFSQVAVKGLSTFKFQLYLKQHR